MTARIVPDDAAGRAQAVEVLRDGGIVALPTDTVYGIARGAGHARRHRAPVRGEAAAARQGGDAAARRRAPRRPGSATITPAAAALAAACWPGGLTVVVPQRPDVRWPAVLTGGSPTIGLRVPDHDAPRALARAVGPLPTTSANLSGAARGRRCGRDRGPARRGDRPRPRRRARARRTGLDRRRLHRRPADDPARRRRPGRLGRRDPGARSASSSPPALTGPAHRS